MTNSLIWWLIPGLVGGSAVLVLLMWRPFRRLGWEIQIERARELFKLQRERLELQFFEAAAATGKPRGLRWIGCQWDDETAFVRDKETGQIASLAAVTIQFEAIPGSDMEGLPAVGNLRRASAVFFFHKGQWLTAGKAVFNLDPREALEHFKNQYEPLG